MFTEKAKSIAVNIAAIITIIILMVWGNTYWRQRTQFLKGERALMARDYMSAIAGYESAIHMYTPGSRLVEISAERLWSMGEGFERTGETERALIAYRSIRSSFYSTHSLYRPGMGWIARCDAKIAQLPKDRRKP